MKLQQYGHQTIIATRSTVYYITGSPGYKNAPWSSNPLTETYLLQLQHGNYKFLTLDPNATFQGQIIKIEPTTLDGNCPFNFATLYSTLDMLKSQLNKPIKPSTILLSESDFQDLKDL